MNDEIIHKFCYQQKIPIFGSIPYSPKASQLCSEGLVLVEHDLGLRSSFEIILLNIRSRRGVIPKVVSSCQSSLMVERQLVKKSVDSKQLTILSGKGGTGKTTIARLLAQTLPFKTICDCDVEGANLNCFFQGESTLVESFSGGFKVEFNESACISCQLCQSCTFDAISFTAQSSQPQINLISCEGCGRCVDMCPTGAMALRKDSTARIFQVTNEQQSLIHGRLFPGGGHSGKLVARIKQWAQQCSLGGWILNDGPPGIGCPAIASINGSDLIIAVTEASKSGFHDLQQLLKLCQSFHLKPLVVLNKADLNEKVAQQVRAFCQEQTLELIGEIRFNPQLWDQSGWLSQKKLPMNDDFQNLANKINQKMEIMMNDSRTYAIPVENGVLTSHFGHAPEFHFITTLNGVIKETTIKNPPPHEPGILPKWLAENGVNWVIAGGIGERAVQLLNNANIQIFIGATSQAPKTLVDLHLQNKLVNTGNACNH